MMMRRTTLTSLLTVGGIVLAVMQMMRRRSRSRGWQGMLHQSSDMMHGLRRGAGQLLHTMRIR